MNNLDKHDIEHLLWIMGKGGRTCDSCKRLRGILAEMQVGIEAVETFRDKQRELIHNHEGVADGATGRLELQMHSRYLEEDRHPIEGVKNNE